MCSPPGGVEVVCESLVQSSRNIINTTPSLVSVMMHHLAVSTKTGSGGSSSGGGGASVGSREADWRRVRASELNDMMASESQQLINFAPMGRLHASPSTLVATVSDWRALCVHMTALSACGCRHCDVQQPQGGPGGDADRHVAAAPARPLGRLQLPLLPRREVDGPHHHAAVLHRAA